MEDDRTGIRLDREACIMQAFGDCAYIVRPDDTAFLWLQPILRAAHLIEMRPPI